MMNEESETQALVNNIYAKMGYIELESIASLMDIPIEDLQARRTRYFGLTNAAWLNSPKLWRKAEWVKDNVRSWYERSLRQRVTHQVFVTCIQKVIAGKIA